VGSLGSSPDKFSIFEQKSTESTPFPQRDESQIAHSKPLEGNVDASAICAVLSVKNSEEAGQ
jgi:hypothetical protein